jgi:DNA-binding transcriptional MerR regulator
VSRAKVDRAYRVEELAAAAKTTVRNVRAYRQRGLLPAPRYEGRIALYGEQHLARLRTIGALLERGYTMENIRELTSAWARGQKLEDVLGLEAALTAPFSDESAEPVDAARLIEELGAQVTPQLIAKALELRVLSLEGAELKAPSPRLLAAGIELSRNGVPLDAMLSELTVLRAAVEQIARRFVALFGEQILDRHGTGLPGPKDIQRVERAVRKVRPLAEVVVDIELAAALEREIREQMSARLGRALTNARTKKKR